jgi:HK97 family phage major capsid protein
MLKQLMLQRKIDAANEALAELLVTEDDLRTRSTELETAIEEAKTDEEIAAVGTEVDKLEGEQADLTQKKSKLEGEISSLEGELEETKSKEPAFGAQVITERGGKEVMKKDTGEFREFGEFLQTVKWNPNDTTLRTRQGQKRELNMGIGAQGGFIVPDQFSSEIKLVDDLKAIFRPRAQVIPAGDPPDAAITIPALDQGGANGVYAGVQVTWIAEGALKPETEPAFREIRLEPNEVAAHVVVTDKLLRNSAAAGALVSSLLRKAIIAAEEDAFLSGNGVGQPLGIIGHPAAIQVARAASNQISYTDIVNMFARAKFGGRLAWVGSQTALPQLMRMVDAGNNLIWQPNAREGAPGTLLGIPFLMNDQSPILGAEGDLILVDLDYYLIKDGSGISISMSEHPLFTQNRTIIKAFWNVDGQPWLSTPLLARDGVSTISPFVVLQ